MNCFLMHNNWFLDQLKTVQQAGIPTASHIWKVTTRRAEDCSCNLQVFIQTNTAPSREFFKRRRRKKKKSRAYILPWFITVKPIINKTQETVTLEINNHRAAGAVHVVCWQSSWEALRGEVPSMPVYSLGLLNLNKAPSWECRLLTRLLGPWDGRGL